MSASEAQPLWPIAVLVVDESQARLRQLLSQLSDLGIRDIDAALTVDQALALARGRDYRLLIANYSLGKLTPDDLLRALDEAGEDIRVVLTEDQSKVAAYQGRAVAWLLRPCSLVELRTAILRALRGGS